MINKDLRPPFKRFKDINPYELFKDLKTPCYVIDEWSLRYNGKILKDIQDKTGAKILLAQKAFSNYDLYNLFLLLNMKVYGLLYYLNLLILQQHVHLSENLL